MGKRKKDNTRNTNDRLGDFVFMNTWQFKKASKEFIEKLCNELLEFYSDRSRLTFEEFFEEKGITAKVYWTWCKEHPTLKEVHEHIKTILAGRREKGMLTGVLREKSGMYVQHQFSDRWKEADLYWSNLQEKDKDKATNYTIVIPPLKKDSE